VRFESHGLAPKSAADFAFLLHGFHFLKDEGVMAIILSHGVLFRGGAVERIRTRMLKDGHIDSVIGLPANLFYTAGILVCILELKKCREPNGVLFINASGPENFDKGKRQNQLSKRHIAKIIDTYQFRKEEPRYSRRVEMDEIKKNDFNLNIFRYVSTAMGEGEIDLAMTNAEIVGILGAIFGGDWETQYVSARAWFAALTFWEVNRDSRDTSDLFCVFTTAVPSSKTGLCGRFWTW
jgi:type I restriction enzyme M protein